VNTALQRTVGVVSVRVAAGAGETEILAGAFTAITGSSISVLHHGHRARRVLWWHHFFFRQPATVVLRAVECKPAQEHADLSSSARALTHDYGARVLIDATVNCFPAEATPTKREEVLEVEPMRRELLEEIPELQLLHGALKTASLADVVWMCVGGNPADYIGLLRAWEDQQRQNIEQVAAHFVQGLIGTAVGNVGSAVAGNAHLGGLFDKFRESSWVPAPALAEIGPARSARDKVLHSSTLRAPAGSRGAGRRILIPADAATALVLRHGVSTVPSIEELKALAMPATK
jgi:hypothetical protein